MKHICQGTNCHTYETQSRIRGTKGNKVLRTRNAYAEINLKPDSWSSPDNWVVYFCDERCMQDWLKKHSAQFMSIVGIKTTPSETPIQVEVETRQDYVGRDYTRKTINKLSEFGINENDLRTL